MPSEPQGTSLPDWLVSLVGRHAIEVEGLRDALRRSQAEIQRLTADQEGPQT